MKIKKKVQPKYFKAVLAGKKRFELRLADFDCEPGDSLLLLEQKQGGKELTGREVDCDILYKFNTKDMNKFHSQEEIDKYGLVVLAIKKK